MAVKGRIVVSGLAVTYPFGGVFWDYLQYVMGFRKLGFEVLYLEDTGGWCYDPERETFAESGERNAAHFTRTLARFGLQESWFFRDAAGMTYGRAWPEVVSFCRNADLLLNLSGALLWRDEYRSANRLAFIDTDPMYTQASLPDYRAGTLEGKARARVERLLAHDIHFTFAEGIGTPDCHVPTDLVAWFPTRQPVVRDHFTGASVPVVSRRKVFTTVASWEPAEEGPVVAGVAYGGKGTEFERFLTLPARSSRPLEVALNGDAPRERLHKYGWRLADAAEVSRDPWVYRDYLANSLGEWSVAKHAYVASQSGWFSGRSACYLALGVPVVVQDTGFSHLLPTGAGLLSFETLEEAVTGLEAVVSDPTRHARAAKEIAAVHFGSEGILTRLLERALASPP